ncbi:hypothetical protein BC829DRAFT_457141 [Chytridium lagenaria]|nr:hypothetical protein BC829DRAFT_457141 [Chytridium lagenaria]
MANNSSPFLFNISFKRYLPGAAKAYTSPGFQQHVPVCQVYSSLYRNIQHFTAARTMIFNFAFLHKAQDEMKDSFKASLLSFKNILNEFDKKLTNIAKKLDCHSKVGHYLAFRRTHCCLVDPNTLENQQAFLLKNKEGLGASKLFRAREFTYENYNGAKEPRESVKKASLVSIVSDAIPAAEEHAEEASAHYDDDYNHLSELPTSVEDMMGDMNEEDVAAAREFHENDEAAPPLEEGNIDEVIALREGLVEVRHSKSIIAEDPNIVSTDSRHPEEGNPSHSNQLTEENVIENTSFKGFTKHSDDQVFVGNTDIPVGGTVESLLAKDLDELLAEVENPTSLTLPHNTVDGEGTHGNAAKLEAVVIEDQSPLQDEAQVEAYNDDQITQELDALMAEVSLVPNSGDDLKAKNAASPKSLAKKDDAGRSQKRMGSINWEDDFFK